MHEVQHVSDETRAAPRRYRDGAMRERFIKVTTELLRRHGLGGVSSRMILGAVGVKAPTLYHHFGDLESLHSAVIDHAFSRYFESRDRRPVARDPINRIRDGWDTFVTFSIAEPELYVIVSQQNVAGTLPPAIRRSRQELIEQLRQLSEVRPLRYDAELAADMFSAACLGTASLIAARRNGLPGTSQVSAALREAVLNGLLL